MLKFNKSILFFMSLFCLQALVAMDGDKGDRADRKLNTEEYKGENESEQFRYANEQMLNEIACKIIKIWPEAASLTAQDIKKIVLLKAPDYIGEVYELRTRGWYMRLYLPIYTQKDLLGIPMNQL